MKIHDIYIVESLNQPAPWYWLESSMDYEAIASIDSTDDLKIQLVEDDYGGWVINFSREGSRGYHTAVATGQGSEFKVFATVVDVIKDWWKEMDSNGQRPESIRFTASKLAGDSSSRVKLYSRFAKKFATQIGYDLKIDNHSNSSDIFILTHPDS